MLTIIHICDMYICELVDKHTKIIYSHLFTERIDFKNRNALSRCDRTV